MNEITIDRDDYQKNLRLQQLRAELDAMGYHVIRKDWVRKFANTSCVGERVWFEADDHVRQRIERHTVENLARALGQYMVDSGAIKWSMESVVDMGRIYRIEANVILRDPQFDKPEWLK